VADDLTPPTDDGGAGTVLGKSLVEEMQTSYMDYAMSVIIARALPDARDGLKPVQRRIIYAMQQVGAAPGSRYKKCAAFVGEVLKDYHPHSDVAVYDALVRMAQPFSLRYPLVDGQGNFGSVDGDPPAAMRYCVAGETRVSTPRGTFRIDQLVPGLRPNSEADADLEVLDRHARPVRANKVFHSGEHPTLRLRTAEGSELIGTHNHPVLSVIDVLGVPMLLWKLLSELEPGDTVVMSKDRQRRRGEASLAPTTRPSELVAAYVRAETGQAWTRRQWERDGEQIVSRIASAEVRAVLEPLVAAGHFYATVASIEDAGVQPVYSVRVESEDHAFLTNGFVSHNTEARLAPIAAEVLADIDKDTVDFIPNYNNEGQEPVVLPARIPNLLINGASGIAVGMTTNIPPHNLREITAAVTHLVENPDATSEDLLRFVSGPDFPTGGIIMGRGGIKQAYATGHGKVVVRARHTFEEAANGRERIIVDELPYAVNKANLVAKISELANERKLEGIADLRDESDRQGMRIVIELKREAKPFTVLNNLYKHTALQQTFGVIMLAIVDQRPVVLGLKQMLQLFVDHRREVILRRTRYQLARAQERAHILEGLKICLDHLDEVIRTIRNAADTETARTQLQEKFGLTEVQAQAVLDLTLRRLTQLERRKIDEEYEETIRLIAYLESILASDQKVRLLIAEEMADVAKKYGDDRRTEISDQDATELSAEDLIPKEEVLVTVTHRGYAKRAPSRTFRAQARGGVGLRGARPTAGADAPSGTREEDYTEHLVSTHTHASLLFFTQSGRVFQLRVHEIPQRDRTAKGLPVNNLIEISNGERVTAVFVRPETADQTARYMLMATRKGYIKKTRMQEYANVRRNGLIAINLQEGDELLWVAPTSGEDDVLLASQQGKAIRFHEREVRAMGRDTQGVIGMKLGRNDLVAGMAITKPGADLLVLSERGYGKRTPLAEYPTHHRGGQGVFTLKVTDRVGRLAALRVTDAEDEEILLISANGMVLRTAVGNISRYGRQTQGVIVMRIAPDDQVVAVCPVGVELEG
jgi:DNA gyrase subunit A